MTRTYRTELSPTPSQRKQLYQFSGAVRFVYNWALAEKKKAYEERKITLKQRDLQPILQTALREQYPWLADAPAYSLLAALQNNDRAFTAFFRRVKKGEIPGYPRFKSKHKRIGGFKFATAVTVSERHINLPKLGPVRMYEKGYLPTGRVSIKSGAVTERAGRWFVSITVEEEMPELTATGKPIGIDFGVKTLATCSNGKTFQNPRTLSRHARRLARLQRELHRRQKGSKNRWKTKRKIARLHYRIASIRENTLQHISTYVTAKIKPTHIVLEDLNVKGMVKNHHLAQAISDAGFGELRRQIEYKAEWYGNLVVLADRWEPSSKRCSACGKVREQLSLSERVYQCPHCGHTEDRDLNAAKNLLALVRTASHAESADT